MIITFNELRRIKDKLPSGSSKRIAEELNMEISAVRNYFGSQYFDTSLPIGAHFEKGPDGGFVTLENRGILDCAIKIISEQRS